MQQTLLTSIACALLGATALAQSIEVRIAGTVQSNAFTLGPLAAVPAGTAVEASFLVDPTVFVNGSLPQTRGYPIVPGSFQFQFGTGSLPLATPYPAGLTPYFTLRNGGSGFDGFSLSTDVDTATGVELNLSGPGLPPVLKFDITVGGGFLSTLDIQDQQGAYAPGPGSGVVSSNLQVNDGLIPKLPVSFSKLQIFDASIGPCGAAESYGAPFQVPLTVFGDLEVGGLAVCRLIPPGVINQYFFGPVFVGLSTAPASLPLFADRFLYIDPNQIFSIVPMNYGLFGWQSTILVPNNPALAGLDVFLQGAGFRFASDPTSLEVSNGIRFKLCS